MAANTWCTVESDPGVFTELISQFGVQGVQVEELYDLEQEHLERIKSEQKTDRPVFGLIFLFKYQPSPLDPATQTLIKDDHPLSEQVYFARQMINNACGTQAILNLLLNLDQEQCARHGITLGDELKNFKDFTHFLPPDLRGEAISNSELIRKAHNGFARPEPFIFEEKKARDDEEGEDAFHFIGYVPIKGRLYELDGLKPGPILLHPAGQPDATVTEETWLAAARTAIQARLQQYASKEIRFNLMALIGNRTQHLSQRIAQLEAQLASSAAAGGAAAMDTSDSSAATAAPSSSALRDELDDLRRELEDEQRKLDRWKVENMRRKHNYIPFVINLLQMLAGKGRLQGLVEAAAKNAAERAVRARQNNAAKRKEPSPPANAASTTTSSSEPPAKK